MIPVVTSSPSRPAPAEAPLGAEASAGPSLNVEHPEERRVQQTLGGASAPKPLCTASSSRVAGGDPEQGLRSPRHSPSTLPFRMRHARAPHGFLCDAARCEDEAAVHYGRDTDPGRAYGRGSTRLCDRHLRLFYRWKELT